jgi:hypothetical protein
MIVEKIFNGDELNDAFARYGRGTQFSRTGFDALFRMLDEYSDATGEPLVLDPIGICCDWTEYESLKDAAKSYGFEGEAEDADLFEHINNETYAVRLEYPDGTVGVLAQC